MIDGHIHIERGPYTPEWIGRFADRAVERGIDEIWLLEHCYRFEEFTPMYASACAHSAYVDAWFHRQAGAKRLGDYLALIARVRARRFLVSIKFGLEICYFKAYEGFIAKHARDKGFDFLLGSVHFVDDFAFDHRPEHWDGVDVDRLFRRYYEDSVAMAESGLFDGIGHPDAIGLFGHKPTYPLAAHYERLAEALAESGMYADQNSGAARRCPDTATLGMNRALLCTLIRHGVRIVTSSDAHRPEDVGDKIAALEARVIECQKSTKEVSP
ncbi:MAG: histidinol phosphate phosphatase [Clostridia bacterium]|nr:histidinol phosphate phosphatase [Clostridia bacterium]